MTTDTTPDGAPAGSTPPHNLPPLPHPLGESRGLDELTIDLIKAGEPLGGHTTPITAIQHDGRLHVPGHLDGPSHTTNLAELLDGLRCGNCIPALTRMLQDTIDIYERLGNAYLALDVLHQTDTQHQTNWDSLQHLHLLLYELHQDRRDNPDWPDDTDVRHHLSQLLDTYTHTTRQLTRQWADTHPTRLADLLLHPEPPPPPTVDMRPFGENWQQAADAMHRHWQRNAPWVGRTAATEELHDRITGDTPIKASRYEVWDPTTTPEPRTLPASAPTLTEAVNQQLDIYTGDVDHQLDLHRNAPPQLLAAVGQPNGLLRMLAELWPSATSDTGVEDIVMLEVPAAYVTQLPERLRQADTREVFHLDTARPDDGLAVLQTAALIAADTLNSRLTGIAHTTLTRALQAARATHTTNADLPPAPAAAGSRT